MAHYHQLRDGQQTGLNQITVSGDHVHSLPNGEFTSQDPDSKTHVHKLPDGSSTPSGPIESDENAD